MSGKPGFITRVLTKAIGKVINNISFPGSSLFSWFLPGTNFDYAVKVGRGYNSSVIVAPVLWICRRFAEAAYTISLDDDPIYDHEILTLLNKPNLFYSGRTLRKAIAMSYVLDGNAYILKVRNNQLKPVQLWYAPHWMIEPKYPANGSEFISYYKYSPGHQTYDIMPNDIIHLRDGLDPENTRKGFSALKALVREVYTDDMAANFSASLLRNMGVPGLIISPADSHAVVGREDKKAVEELLTTYTKDNAGKPLVLSGPTRVEQFGFDPKKLDLGLLRDIPEERVTAVLGVSAAAVGFGTGLQQTKVGATMRELRKASYEDCIIPMNTIVCEELDNHLTPDFEPRPEKYKLSFDVSNVRVMQEDEDNRTIRITNLVNNTIIRLDEGRQELGWEVKPEHEVWIVPIGKQIIPAAEIGKPPELPPQQPVPGQEGNQDEQQEEEKTFLPVIDLKTRNWKRDLQAAFDRDVKQLSSSYSRQIRKKFDDLGDEAAEAFERILSARGVEMFSAKKPELKMTDDEYVSSVMDDLDFDVIKYAAHYLNVTKKTFGTVNAILNWSVNLTDEHEAQAMKQGGTRLGLLDIKGDTKKAIYDALAEARAAGEGPYQAARRIRDYVSGGHWKSAATRADEIARTETKYCQNWSSVEAYKAGGINQVEIVDGRLPTSDEDCINRNGQIMPIDEAMSLDEHPNGTLSFNPVIGDFNG